MDNVPSSTLQRQTDSPHTRRTSLACSVLLFTLILFGAMPTAGSAQEITCHVFVDENVSGGSGSGDSWGNSYDELRDALADLAASDPSTTTNVCVAGGTYTPDASDVDVSFELRNFVNLYGGFTGDEAATVDLSTRDLGANETVLSGDLGAGNSHHVVNCTGGDCDNSVEKIVDGFVITGGHAVGTTGTDGTSVVLPSPGGDGAGGGLYNEAGTLELFNIVFTSNEAEGGLGGGSIFDVERGGNGMGGGLYNGSGTVAIINGIFSNNKATGGKGGAGFDSGGGGGAGIGGGLHSESGELTLRNVVFADNEAVDGASGSCSTCDLPGPQFAAAGDDVSQTDDVSKTQTVGNSTFSSVIVGSGGGLNNAASTMTVTNGIFWGNTLNGDPSQISGSGTVTHSIVEDGFTGTGNSSDDPLFLDEDDPDGADDTWFTADDGLQLTETSPAIDAGTDQGVTLPETDLLGNPRVFDGDGILAAVVDMGPYEFGSTAESPGSAALLDFGDAPAPYPTLLAADGARHGIPDGGATFVLGKLIDTDADGQPDDDAGLVAGGDDGNDIDDEDGVLSFNNQFAYSAAHAMGWLELEVTGGSGFLNAWIDFNGDGDWDDAFEQIFTDEPVTAITQTLLFTIPSGTVTAGPTFARFRLSTAGGDSYDGEASDGEVEDYQVQFVDGDAVQASISQIPGLGDLTVKRNGANFQIFQDGTLIFEVPINLLTNGIEIVGTDDADLLTIDFSGGDPIPSAGLTFNGGDPTTEPGDALALENGTFATSTYTFDNASDGSIALNASTITYTGLEPIADNLSVTDRVFTFSAASEIITMEDDGTPANFISKIDSDFGESVTFLNPSNSLTINGGNGADQITINKMDKFFEADLTVNGEGLPDTITLNDVYAAGADASVAVNGQHGDDVISILANNLPKKNAHTLNGQLGIDAFNLFFEAGKEIRDNSGTALTIIGSTPNANPLAREMLNVFTNEPGDGVRSIDLVYNSAVTSHATLHGLGTENGITLMGLENVNFTGDDADDDDATLTYTSALDVATVEPTGPNSANVFLGGTPFSGVTPPLLLATPGVADGQPGPDLSFDGLASASGLLLKGEDPTTVPGDELYYHGSGNVDVTGTATGKITAAGMLDVNFTSFENHYTSGLAYVYVTADVEADDATPDLFIVRMLDDVSGEVVVEVNGVIKHKHLLSEVGTIEIDGSGDDDQLIVDFGDGNPIPVSGLFFNGNGETTGDDVVLNNGGFADITHTFDNANDGSVLFESGSARLLTYTGLEPIIDNLTADNRVFDFSSAGDNVSLDYSGTPGYAVISTSGPPTSESVTFVYPTESLTINGNAGEDVIDINELPGFGFAEVSVNGGLADDVISINATFGGAAFDVNGDDGDDVVHTFATSGTVIPSFTITGGDGHDRFNIQPDFVEIVVYGGTPTFPDFPGDVLDADLTGVTDDAISASNGDGAWTFSNRDDVTFYSIEGLYDVADLSLKKTASNTVPLVGESVTFTITVTNDGDTGHAFDVSVLDVIPGGLLFESASGDGTYDENTGIWTVGDVPQNETRSLNITVKLKASTVITNKAQVIFPAGYHNYPKTASAHATITPWEQATVWRNANREAGTITGLAHLPATAKSASGTIFAGSDGGGIHRSIDGGENWYPTGSGVIRSANVRELATSSTSGALWAATYLTGAWRSDDLGESYTKVFEDADGSDNVLSVAINTNNPVGGGDGDVFLGTDGDGIFVSHDDGGTWTDISSNLPNLRIMSIFVEPNGAGGSKDRVWVATYGSGVFYLNYVGGPALNLTWIAANGTDPAALDVKFVHAVTKDGLGNLYAGTTGGIFQSTDNGATWALVEDGKTDPWASPIVVRTFLTYFDGTTHFVWAGTDGEFIYRSMGTASVGGAGTWEQETGFPSLDGTSGLRSGTIYDLFIVDGVLFAATRDYGLHRSDSNGKWWDHVSAEILNPVIQAMTFSADGSKLFAGTYGWGVLMTDDFDGSTFVNWTRVNNGLLNHWVYAMDRRIDGADEYLFAGTWGGGVFVSEDGGESWLFSGLPHGIIHDLAVNAHGTVFAAMDRGQIARSVDNGLTWQEIGVATTAIWSIGIDPSDPDVMYAGTAGAGIYVTYDGGFSWTRSGLTDRYIFAIEFDASTVPAIIYAATATGVIRSFDGGATWSDLSTGLTVAETRTLAILGTATPGEPLMTAGTWGGGVFTYDWTVSAWIRDGIGEAPIVAFAINPETREGFVSTNEGGLFRRQFPGARTSTSAEPDPANGELPTAVMLDQNYPNPFNPQTTVDFSLPSPVDVRVAVYDALGRTIRVLVDGALPAGRHAVTFEAGDLPSGTYFYQLRAGDQVVNKKMVLLK